MPLDSVGYGRDCPYAQYSGVVCVLNNALSVCSALCCLHFAIWCALCSAILYVVGCCGYVGACTHCHVLSTPQAHGLLLDVVGWHKVLLGVFGCGWVALGVVGWH